MRLLKNIFDENKKWAEDMIKEDPSFFEKLAATQTPEYLWIGCADSRVPSNQIMGQQPGDVFVHRNVANQVMHADLNMLSVLQYAVEVLRVKHVIVCGHYGCGGVRAAMETEKHGLIDNWLRAIKDTYAENETHLNTLGEHARVDRMCELNVHKQVLNVCHTTIVQDAWASGQDLAVHGWIYGLQDGLLRDLGLCFRSEEQVGEVYRIGSSK